jgi:hypothetical protein
VVAVWVSLHGSNKPGHVGATVAVFAERSYLLAEILRTFSGAWISVLREEEGSFLKERCTDIVRGVSSTGLLEATRQRFQALLRGHTTLFVHNLARNFGLEAVCCLPPSDRPLGPEALQDALEGTEDLPIGAKVLLYILRAMRVPSVKEMVAGLNTPALRVESIIPFAPVVPGYW